MANDSTTLGYLTPVSPPQINDRALEDAFGDAIAGITGLGRDDYVRPRIQPEPPNFPNQETDWCAFAVTPYEHDTFAYMRQLPALEGGGGQQVERDEYLDVLISFYGANSNAYMARWREGLMVDQNRYALADLGIRLVGLGKPQAVPSLLKNRYVRRIDLSAQFTRRMTTAFAVRYLQSANGVLHTEELPPVPIIVNN